MKTSLGWAAGALTMMALAAPAWARDDDRRYRGDYGRGAYGVGYERGYHEGAQEGSRDARGGRRFEYWREGRYRDGDHGYRSSYGPRWEYTRGFRRGYEEGYRRGYASRRDIYENGRYGYGDGRYRDDGYRDDRYRDDRYRDDRYRDDRYRYEDRRP
jgi:hypothetical protein